jgi:hypothetical protein
MKLKLNTKAIGIGAVLIAVILSFGVIRSIGKRARGVNNNAVVATRLSHLPPVILWAWERPEHLEFIDPKKVGVAFLSQTLYLRGNKVVTRPRLQPLNVPEGTTLIAVTRIEVDHAEPPSLSADQVKRAAAEITTVAGLPRVVAVQIDFDAAQSEHSFYRELLLATRRTLPESTGLSITALASWCKGDDWLRNLPLDEAVPMLFRMGVERRQILSQLASGGKFNAAPCGGSAGISIDEPLAYAPTTERLYVFNPKSWSPSDLQRVRETYQR